jgi:hypothetical protein
MLGIRWRTRIVHSIVTSPHFSPVQLYKFPFSPIRTPQACPVRGCLFDKIGGADQLISQRPHDALSSALRRRPSLR